MKDSNPLKYGAKNAGHQPTPGCPRSCHEAASAAQGKAPTGATTKKTKKEQR